MHAISPDVRNLVTTLATQARRRGIRLLPVDSEHNAVFQCLEGHAHADVSRIILTASGGAFRDWPAERLAHATAGSVGGDQQARGDLALAIGIGDPDMAQSIAGIAQPDEARRAITGEVLQRCEPRFECLAEIARHHDAADPSCGGVFSCPDPAVRGASR